MFSRNIDVGRTLGKGAFLTHAFRFLFPLKKKTEKIQIVLWRMPWNTAGRKEANCAAEFYVSHGPDDRVSSVGVKLHRKVGTVNRATGTTQLMKFSGTNQRFTESSGQLSLSEAHLANSNCWEYAQLCSAQ